MPEDKIPKKFRNGQPIYDDEQVKLSPLPSEPGQSPTKFKNGQPIYLGQSLVPGTSDVSKAAPEGDIPDPTPFIRRAIPGLLPMGGAMAGSMLGPLGTAGGAAVGSLASQGLRKLVPGLFGDTGPADLGESVMETGKDVLGQAVIPGIVGKLLKSGLRKTLAETVAGTWLNKLPGVRKGVSDEMGREVSSMVSPESDIVERLGTKAADTKNIIASKLAAAQTPKTPTLFNAQGNPIPPSMPSSALTQAQQEMADQFGTNSIGKKLVNMGEESQLPASVARQQTYKAIPNEMLSDITHVRNAKLVTGDLEGIEKLALNKAIAAGGAEGRINPSAVLKELNGPRNEIYGEAIRPAAKAGLESVLKEMETQIPTGVAKYVANYSKGHLLMKLPAAVIGAHLGPLGVGGTAIALTDTALAQFASNPTNAKLLVQAMRSGASSPNATFFQNAILTALRGSEVLLTTPDGKEKRVTIPAGETSQ